VLGGEKVSYMVSLKDGRELFIVAKDACIEVGCTIFFDEKDAIVAVFPIREIYCVISFKQGGGQSGKTLSMI
jgi:hypothetical protein